MTEKIPRPQQPEIIQAPPLPARGDIEVGDALEFGEGEEPLITIFNTKEVSADE